MPLPKTKGRPDGSTAPPGFTLVEIIVVVVILAIIAAIVLPQATGISDVHAQSAARTVLADLEYAQNYAVVTQTSISVTFSTSGNSYKVHVYNQSDPINHPITKKAYAVDFDTASGFQNVSVAAASFGGGSVVTFDALGAPNAGGTVDIASGEHTYRITVAPVTGRATVARVP